MTTSWGAGILFRPRILRMVMRRFALLMAMILCIALLAAITGVGGNGDRGLTALMYAGVIGAPLALAEAYAFGSASATWHRRWPFAAVLAFKSLAYAAWIAIGATITAMLTHTHDPATWYDLVLHKDTLIAAAIIALTINVLLAASRLIGVKVLIQMLSGRYYRPRPEERLFVFLDVAGSTGLAEHHGDLRFHQLINDLFHIVEVTITEADGEIHDYIGDQVMASWMVPEGRNGTSRGAAPLHWLVALKLRLDEARPRFEANYGSMPVLRIGMHLGPVIAAEVGTFRRKITYFGDTVNTAARIEELARDHDAFALVTAPVMNRFAFPQEALTATLVGTPQLRGKQQSISVYRINWRGAS